MPAALLGQGKSEETAEVTKIEAEAAFIVAIMPDGKYAIIPDINAPVITKRAGDPDDFRIALRSLSSDIEAERIAIMAAQHTVNMQVQYSRQAMEAQQSQQILSQLGNKR
jgi:hypothetical protein